MQTRNRQRVTLTHLPTGLSATQHRDGIPYRASPWVDICTALARRKLASHLCRPTEPPREVRKYDLCPPLGIAPNIRQGDRWLVTGAKEVRSVLDGNLDLMWKP